MKKVQHFENGRKRSFAQRFDAFAIRLIDVAMFAIFALCIIGVIGCMVKYSLSRPEHFRLWEIVYLIPVGLCMAAMFVLITRSLSLPSGRFLLLWSLVFVAWSVIAILIFNSPPQGDGGGIFNEALYLNSGGEFVLDASNYFYRCYWLMGAVAFEKFLMGFIGTSYLTFKFFGALLLLGSGLCLYRIAKNLADDLTARIVYALYVLFIPITLNVSHFAHQHVAFFCLMVAMLLLCKPTLPRAALAGLFLGAMDIFRPWGILVLLSVFCFAIYKLIIAHNGSERLRIISAVIVLLVPFFVVGVASDAALERAGLISTEVTENSSMALIKLDRGIDPEMNSFGKLAEEKTANLQGDEYNRAMSDLYSARIKELLTSKTPYVYVVEKLIRMFGEVDYWFENLFADKGSVYDYPVRIVYFFNWFQYALMLPIALYGYLLYRKSRSFSLLTVFTIGYVAAHIFIEAFSAYRICLYPVLLIYAAYGLKTAFARFDEGGFRALLPRRGHALN